MGKEATNDFIDFLALNRDVLSFMALGDWFQIWMASLVNVFWLLFDTFASLSKPADLALVFMTSAWHSKSSVLIG